MVSSPDFPDPMQTAQAQAGLNQSTATTQQLLNQTNQITPTGTLTYQKSGTNSFMDSNGNVTYVPQFTATTTLTPEQQQIFDTNQQTQQNIAGIGRDQSARIGELLGTPLDLGEFSADTAAIEDWISQRATQRLDPRFAAEEEATRARLANSGIQAGSEAYDREMANFLQGKNDAYNQLALTGRSQAFNELLTGRQQSVQEMLTERNQPINEISALMSGSQVSMPQFVSTPQTSVAGVDYTGLVTDKFKAESEAQQAMLGGLFGLASAPFGMFSFGG